MNEALQALLESSDTDALKQLIDQGGLSALSAEDKAELPRTVAQSGDLALLTLLCEQSHVIAFAPDARGRDVLHHAAMSGNAEMVAYAVDRLGFDPLRGDQSGKTALDLASTEEARHALEERAGFTLAEAYRNPVKRGFAPDPSVVRVGEDFYMIHSSFTHFPCLPISHSRDLVNWRTIGHVITELHSSGVEGEAGGFGYWAADISFHNGRFWVIATLRRGTPPYRLQMITSSLRPEGGYDPPKFLPLNGIDPSLFTDVDGRRYVLLNPGAQLSEIDESGELISEPQLIYYGTARVKTEGPHLLYKDGWYYLFQAEGGTGAGHMETVARSRTLRGVYKPCPFNPILGRKEENAPIRRSGHGKPVQLADGRWMMLYLCSRDVDGLTVMGRETALDALTWTADGWPMVNDLKGASCLQRKPLPDRVDESPADEWLAFIAPRTDPRTFAKRTDAGWQLSAGCDPSELANVSALLHRQSERTFIQRVTVDVSGLASGSTAGLCGYYDERSFFLFGAQRTEAGLDIVVWQQRGDERVEECLTSLTGNAATLTIRGDGRMRALHVDAATSPILTLDASYLSDEGVSGGKRFTGATLGMAAVGEGTAHMNDYFEQMMEGDEHDG